MQPNTKLSREIVRNTIITELSLYPVGSFMSQIISGNRSAEEIKVFINDVVLPYLEATAASLQVFYALAEATTMPTPAELHATMTELSKSTREDGEVILNTMVDKTFLKDNLEDILKKLSYNMSDTIQ